MKEKDEKIETASSDFEKYSKWKKKEKKKKKDLQDPITEYDVMKDILKEKGAREKKDAIIEDWFIGVLKNYDFSGTTDSDATLLEMYTLKIELQYLLEVADKGRKRKTSAVYKHS